MARIIKREKKKIHSSTGDKISFERKTRVDNETGDFSMTVPEHVAALFESPVTIPYRRRFDPRLGEPKTRKIKVHTYRTRGYDKPDEYVIEGGDLKELSDAWDDMMSYYITQNVENRFVIIIMFRGILNFDPEWTPEMKMKTRSLGLRGSYGSGSEDMMSLGFELAQEQKLPNGDAAYFKAELDSDGDPYAQPQRRHEHLYSRHKIVSFTKERWDLLTMVQEQLRALILTLGEHFGESVEPEALESFLDGKRLLKSFKSDDA